MLQIGEPCKPTALSRREQFLEDLKKMKWTRDDISILNVRLVSPETPVATGISGSAGPGTTGQKFESPDALTDFFVKRAVNGPVPRHNWGTVPPQEINQK